MITASTARLSPGLALTDLTTAVALGAQDVLHLHGLDHAQRLAGLDLLAGGDVDRLDQARHRAEQQLGGVGRGLLRHQGRQRRLALGVDVGLARMPR